MYQNYQVRTEIDAISELKDIESLTNRNELHQLAKAVLEEGDTKKAIAILMHAEKFD